MATIGELARHHTSLGKEQIAHLVNLSSEWGMLADLCFSDLMLHVSRKDGSWFVLSQVRAATGQTLYLDDSVGVTVEGHKRALLEKAHSTATIVEDEVFFEGVAEDCRLMAVPVVHRGEVIAVMSREWSRRTGRQLGELERNYLDLFNTFAAMMVRGDFPFVGRVADSSVAPRVGDGAIVLDDRARIRYSSPNAMSALRRVGISTNVLDQTLAELGFAESSVRQAFERKQPVVEEFEQVSDVTLLTRCIPLVITNDGERNVTGALMLVRDVTELRRRDRLILSKDATIREIHHRVKNNLQTISSLLRLQARRLQSEEAKAAVAESVRRIRTIALVHEALSHEPGDDVAFVEIVRPLLRLVEESLQSPDRPMRFEVRGDGGRLPAHVVTPLSVVVTELLQNAVDHGYTEGDGGGNVVVRLASTDSELTIEVIDDGRGIAPDFSLEDATGLGLSIVRTLVTTELAGRIEMRPARREDLDSVGLTVAPGHTGTVIELRVPIEGD